MQKNEMGMDPGARPAFSRAGVQIGHGGRPVVNQGLDGQPAVAVIDHALPAQLGAHAAQNDGRVRHGQRLGIGPDPVEVHELAVVGGFLLRPQGLHGLSRCSLKTCQRRLGGVPWFCISSRIQPAPTPNRKRPLEMRSKGRHLLGLI